MIPFGSNSGTDKSRKLVNGQSTALRLLLVVLSGYERGCAELTAVLPEGLSRPFLLVSELSR